MMQPHQTYMLIKTADSDDQIHPAGRHVPQTSGEPSQGLPAWIAADPNGSLDNTDVVLWHTFGLTHFPTPEDYPVMPAEPMTVSPNPIISPLHTFRYPNPRICPDRAPRFSFGRETFSRKIRVWMFRRRILARRARLLRVRRAFEGLWTIFRAWRLVGGCKRRKGVRIVGVSKGHG